MCGKKLIWFVAVIISVSALMGCTPKKEAELPKFMVINDEEITEEEFNVYLQEAVRNFEAIGGVDIWETDFDGRYAPDVAKESALNSMTAVKVTAQKAEDFGITLDENEKKAALSDADALIEEYGVDGAGADRETVAKVMEDRTLYSKIRSQVVSVYAISDAEYEAYYENYYESTAENLRQITIRGIFCSTEEEINEVYQKLVDGGDFDALYEEYNNKELEYMPNGTFVVSQGDLDLEWGEFIGAQEGFLSKPDELEEGYGIFKVTEIKESDKDTVIAKMREDYTNSVWQEIFSSELEKWQNGSKIYKNEEAWREISIIDASAE